MFHLLLATLLCSALLVDAGEYDFTVEVPAGKFQCYFQSVDGGKHKTIEIDYQVIDGGDLNINFMLLLGADIIAQDKLKTDGSHRIDVQSTGEYQICFDNSFSYQTRKVVFFEVFLFDQNGNLDDSDLANLAVKDDGLKQRMEAAGVAIADFHNSASKIKSQLNKVEYHQALLRAHEARDRAVMNANFDRVTFWSVANSLVLIGVGLVQVFMIRSLFEDNSKVGRLLRH